MPAQGGGCVRDAVRELIPNYWRCREPNVGLVHLVVPGSEDLKQGLHTFETLFRDIHRMSVIPDKEEVDDRDYCPDCIAFLDVTVPDPTKQLKPNKYL